MAATFQIFESAWTFIDGKLDVFLAQDVANVIAQVAGPMRAALVLYVLLYGFAILRGAISEPFVDFAVRSLKLAVIYMLSTTVAYSDWVIQPLFHALPDALTQAVSGSSSPDVGTAFDNFFSRAAYLGEKIGETGNPINVGPFIVAGAVYLIGALAAAIGFGVALVAKVSLALLVALGPVFVACALFDASRRFFFGWLAQAVNYVLLMTLIVVVFQLVLSLVDNQWGSIDGGDPTAGGLMFIALCILGAIFFLQTPAIAAGIAGGASSGLADFGNAIGAPFRGKTWSFTPPTTQSGRPQTPRTGGALRPVGSLA